MSRSTHVLATPLHALLAPLAPFILATLLVGCAESTDGAGARYVRPIPPAAGRSQADSSSHEVALPKKFSESGWHHGDSAHSRP